MFQYEVQQEGLSVEELLRTKWRLGKRLSMNYEWQKP